MLARPVAVLLSLFSALFVISCGRLTARAASPEDRSQAIARIRPSIVQIVVLNPVTKKSEPLGTGFFVNRDAYVVTALHVIVDGKERLAKGNEATQTLGVGMAIGDIPGSFVGVPLGVVDIDENRDLAVVRALRNPFKGEADEVFKAARPNVSLSIDVATFARRAPADGNAIGISGFPFEASVLVTHSGWIAASRYRAYLEDRRKERVELYIADVAANRGNSGGPAYFVEDAAVFGVCMAGRGGNLTYIMPTRYVIDLLKKRNIAWTEQ